MNGSAPGSTTLHDDQNKVVEPPLSMLVGKLNDIHNKIDKLDMPTQQMFQLVEAVWKKMSSELKQDIHVLQTKNEEINQDYEEDESLNCLIGQLASSLVSTANKNIKILRSVDQQLREVRQIVVVEQEMSTSVQMALEDTEKRVLALCQQHKDCISHLRDILFDMGYTIGGKKDGALALLLADQTKGASSLRKTISSLYRSLAASSEQMSTHTETSSHEDGSSSRAERHKANEYIAQNSPNMSINFPQKPIKETRKLSIDDFSDQTGAKMTPTGSFIDGDSVTAFKMKENIRTLSMESNDEFTEGSEPTQSEIGSVDYISEARNEAGPCSRDDDPLEDLTDTSSSVTNETVEENCHNPLGKNLEDGQGREMEHRSEEELATNHDAHLKSTQENKECSYVDVQGPQTSVK
jgi:hypothetical protein